MNDEMTNFTMRDAIELISHHEQAARQVRYLYQVEADTQHQLARVVINRALKCFELTFIDSPMPVHAPPTDLFPHVEKEIGCLRKVFNPNAIRSVETSSSCKIVKIDIDYFTPTYNLLAFGYEADVTTPPDEVVEYMKSTSLIETIENKGAIVALSNGEIWEIFVESVSTGFRVTVVGSVYATALPARHHDIRYATMSNDTPNITVYELVERMYEHSNSYGQASRSCFQRIEGVREYIYG